MSQLTPLILLSSTLLIACGGGSSSNPYGACADAVAQYQEANDIEPEANPQASDFDDGEGNFGFVSVGFSGGEAQVASFEWGNDIDGCEAVYE